MLAHLMRHPAGLMKKAWRITLRRSDVPTSEPAGKAEPPLWPHHYRGIGISLGAITMAPAPAHSAGDAAPIGHVTQYGRAASFLDPTAP